MDANPLHLMDTFKKKLTVEELESLIIVMNEADNYLYELVCQHYKDHYPQRAKEMFVTN